MLICEKYCHKYVFLWIVIVSYSNHSRCLITLNLERLLQNKVLGIIIGILLDPISKALETLEN
jgi:hypothetical protein